eukprot:g17885.t1
MGEILNEYIALVFTKEKDMEDSEICVEHTNTLGQLQVNKEVVLDLLKNIKVDKSPGPNGIYSRFLRQKREQIYGALTKIFVSSPATGKILEDWRVDNVVP